jgi:hypothetical protein
MLLLAAAAGGCTTVIEGPEPPAMGSGESTTVRVNFAEAAETAGDRLAGKGTLASAAKVVVSRLGPDGRLVEIATADIDPSGGIEVPIANTQSPGEVLILQVENISGAIVGSTVLNGIPAFFKGFLIDVPVDTATSFKTEILMTMANGGVPGVQNYLNVVNTFVDAELAGSIAVFNAFVLDFNSLFGAFATAAIETQGLINEQLEAAGLPVDADAIRDSQLMALAGAQGTISTAAGNVVTNAKNLVAQLQEATANAAAPVDKAIFDAIVGGDAMFKSTFKAKVAAKPSTAGHVDAFAFPLVKAGFKLESEVARDRIVLLFKNASVDTDAMAMLDTADATFAARVAQAKDVQALAAAKTAYKETLFGQQTSMQGSLVAELATVFTNLLATMNNVKATVDPLSANLETALTKTNLTAAGIQDALATFDAGAQGISTKLQTVTTAKNADALAEALKTTEKVVLP